MNKAVCSIILTSLMLTLSSCSTTQNQILNLTGAPIGVETAKYKVSGAGGVIASVIPKNAQKSSYRYGFTIDLKKATSVSSVRIERINKDNSKTLIIDDSAKGTKSGSWQTQSPNDARSYLWGKGVGNVGWVGQSPSYNMTKSQAPWLYQSGNTKQTYLITITDLQGKVSTLTQHTIIPKNTKAVYLQILR
ncbi:MAG: hypothetical protein CSA42_03520 [Gammaproteobacteria bacterium]|nr:MAG: hypothetical protein CSA42_03520 [Gammaproteobacteria bacterium]